MKEDYREREIAARKHGRTHEHMNTRNITKEDYTDRWKVQSSSERNKCLDSGEIRNRYHTNTRNTRKLAARHLQSITN